MPDGTSRFSIGKTKNTSLHGVFDSLAQHTVLPEIAVAKVRQDAPFRQDRLRRLRV